MRPVNGNIGKDGQGVSEDDQRAATLDISKTRKVRRDIDSSDEYQSEEGSAKRRDSAPIITSKPSSKTNDKELPVAPSSTTYLDQTSTEPTFRPSGKRAAFRDKLQREKEIGIQSSHRKRAADLERDHPELEQLRNAQRMKDGEKALPELDPATLVKQAKARGGHLEVQVRNKKDANVLATILDTNPFIKSLKLNINLGGPCGEFSRESLINLALSAIYDEGLHLLDTESFRHILRACKYVQSLNLSGCRLANADWETLAECLNVPTRLKRLELGGGDQLPSSEGQALLSWIGEKNSSLHELIIDGLFTDLLPKLLYQIRQHGEFTLIELKNIAPRMLAFESWTMESLFKLSASNPKLKYLSMAGTRSFTLLPANDEGAGQLIDHDVGSRKLTAEARRFKRHNSLLVLDLDGCGLSEAEMNRLAIAAKRNTALLNIYFEGNAISDKDRAKLVSVSVRNRQEIEKKVGVAFDLLISHAASQLDSWPPELIQVLIENTPPEVLLDIAKVIVPADGAAARRPDPTDAPGKSTGYTFPKLS